MGIQDKDKVYQLKDLANGNVIFCVTGVTAGSFCDGVKFLGDNQATSHSVVMRSTTKAVREIKATHYLDLKPDWN